MGPWLSQPQRPQRPQRPQPRVEARPVSSDQGRQSPFGETRPLLDGFTKLQSGETQTDKSLLNERQRQLDERQHTPTLTQTYTRSILCMTILAILLSTLLLSTLRSCLPLNRSNPSQLPSLSLARAQPSIIPSPVNHTGSIEGCAGYKLSAVTDAGDTGFDGELTLIGSCNAFGPDYPSLNLSVRYETRDRVRVRIVDKERKAHVVPDDVAGNGHGHWPQIGEHTVSKDECALSVSYTADPFSFTVTRKSDGEVLFDTTGQALIFEEQYLRIRSALAPGSNIQGLGQHNDNFTLPIAEENYTRTLWSRDAGGLPPRTNLYGTHPVYVNQKVGEGASASGAFFLNSQGMDVKFPGGNSIEYNALGGIVDLFFFNGPTPGDVARQGSQVWGQSKEVPYWSLGFHSCRYGYSDIAYVAEVVANYTAAGIPLQTQWMDIDYMFQREIMTLDPYRFALDKVRYVVDQLHASGRDFMVMVDPSTFSGSLTDDAADYTTFQRGKELDVFLKHPDGSLYEGVVWPGPTAFPDWTHANAQAWWDEEMGKFFDKENGVDVSGIWLDMNEPANFMPYAEANIYRIAMIRESPPVRELPRIIPRSIPGFEKFTAGKNISEPFSSTETSAGSGGANRKSWNGEVDRDALELRAHSKAGNIPRPDPKDPYADYMSPELDSQWLYPPYRIGDRTWTPTPGNPNSNIKNISDLSARTDLVQANGARTYDEHNLYGSRHAILTRHSLLARSPTKRPFTIARSSFSGTPSGLWLGDNVSTWAHYIETVRQMLQFAAIAGVGIIGADTCGLGGVATETLCARWAWLGAFNTFYRNHDDYFSPSQEFYRWNLTTIAARAAGRVRLQMLDYTYSTLAQNAHDGTPVMWPLSWLHANEPETVTVENQFYYGPAVLVNPVVQENSTSVAFYLPKERYYDFFTYAPVEGEGAMITREVGYDTMALYYKSGTIVPLRDGQVMTTGENRKLPFKLVVAPASSGSAPGSAEGYLRLDDGESLDMGDQISDIVLKFDGTRLSTSGTFGYAGGDRIGAVVFAGQSQARGVKVNGVDVPSENVKYDEATQTISVSGLDLKLDGQATIDLV